MKKFLFPALAVLAVLAAPAAYARTMQDADNAGSWRVLSDANTHSCYAANRPATSGETLISGPYATEAQAVAAAGSNVQCEGEFGSQ